MTTALVALCILFALALFLASLFARDRHRDALASVKGWEDAIALSRRILDISDRWRDLFMGALAAHQVQEFMRGLQ